MNDKTILAVINARARILSGTPISDIKEWLLSQGLEQRDADIVIADCMRERTAKIQKIGLRNLLLGCLLAMIGSLAFVAMYFAHMYLYPIVIPSALAWVIGLWRITVGVKRLLNLNNSY
jgi:hypothetical protein